jgi:hypothetical protein
LDDIKNEEALFQSKKKRKALRDAAAMQEAAQTPDKEQQKTAKSDFAKQEVESVGGVKFY